MEAKSVEDDEREGRHYTVYSVFVQRTNLNGPASTWTVERRYSEFEILNARLKGLYHWVSQIEFPGKMLKDLMQNKKLLVETRRKSLEKYLQVCLHLTKYSAIAYLRANRHFCEMLKSVEQMR